MLRIVMDSAGDIPKDWVNKYDINVIPINIHFGGEQYLQGVNLSNNDFYRLVDEKGIIPKTSQPSPQQFVDYYKKIAEPGDTILSIHVTSKLSGTYASAELASRELQGDYEIIPFDSAAGSVAQGYMCLESRSMERDGASVAQIMERLEYIKDHIQIILTLDTLDYARMSGRVKTLQAALASMLNVKPIVILEDGILDTSDKVRTRKKSIVRIIEIMQQRVGQKEVNAAVVHARDQKSGQHLFEEVSRIFNCKQLILSELSIGLAANLGPGTVGIIAYPIGNG